MSYTPKEDLHLSIMRGLTDALADRPRLAEPQRRRINNQERIMESPVITAISAAASSVYADRLRLPTEDEARDVFALELALSGRALTLFSGEG